MVIISNLGKNTYNQNYRIPLTPVGRYPKQMNDMSDTLLVRPATPDDAPAMCGLLNHIIANRMGTAHRNPFDEDRMVHHYIQRDTGIACHVAYLGETLAGFQSLNSPNPAMPDERIPHNWGGIATFVNPDCHRRGVGSGLFHATASAARAKGIAAIEATIADDNAMGLAYYGAMGFEGYFTKSGTYRDGTPLIQICKKFPL